MDTAKIVLICVTVVIATSVFIGVKGRNLSFSDPISLALSADVTGAPTAWATQENKVPAAQDKATDSGADRSSPSMAASPPLEAKEPGQGEFNDAERKALLSLARRTLDSVVRNGTLPDVAHGDFVGHLSLKRGCFVTLNRHGQLRGCIGHIFAQESLYLAVMDNAQSAALKDPRFPPVTHGELDSIEIEISVLTEPVPLGFSTPEELLTRLQPLKDGVVLKMGLRRSTFLPQVWEQLPDKIDFLSHLSRKAGAASDAWREPGTEVLIYHAEAFHESRE